MPIWGVAINAPPFWSMVAASGTMMTLKPFSSKDYWILVIAKDIKSYATCSLAGTRASSEANAINLVLCNQKLKLESNSPLVKSAFSPLIAFAVALNPNLESSHVLTRRNFLMEQHFFNFIESFSFFALLLPSYKTPKSQSAETSSCHTK